MKYNKRIHNEKKNNNFLHAPHNKGSKLQCNRCGKYYRNIHYVYDSELKDYNWLCGYCLDDEFKYRDKICKECWTNSNLPHFVRAKISEEERRCGNCARL